MELMQRPPSDRQLPAHVPQPASLPAGVPVIPQNYVHPGLSLRQVMVILWAYRRWFAAIVLGIVILTGIVSKLMPKTYVSSATLMVDFEINDPLTGREFPLGLMASYMSTQMEFIKSPTILGPVVDELQLTRDKEFTAGFPGGNAERLRQWVIDSVEKNLQVEQQGFDSRFVSVAFSARSADKAAQVANKVAEVYLSEHLKRANGPARQRATRYGEQLDELRKQVDDAQQRVTEFRQKSGLINLDDKADVDMQRLSDLDGRLAEAQQQLREAEMRSARNANVDKEVLGSTIVQQLKGQEASLESRLAELQSTLGPRHPQIVELQSQLASIRQRLQMEIGSYRGNAQSEVAAARRIVQQLQTALDQQRAKVSEQQTLRDEGSRYIREFESAKLIYERALDGYDQVLLGSQGDYSNVSIVDPAQPPLKHSKPKTLKNVLFAFVFACFLGVAIPLLWELMNRRVRCREDLERDLGIPVLVELGPVGTRGFAA